MSTVDIQAAYLEEGDTLVIDNEVVGVISNMSDTGSDIVLTVLNQMDDTEEITLNPFATVSFLAEG